MLALRFTDSRKSITRCIVLLVSVLSFFLAGCSRTGVESAAGSPPQRKKMSALERLGSVMAGSYSSEAQAKADTAFYDIRLEMVRIWPERTDGYWLYVEQAVSSYLDRPYRQRVYRLSEEPDGRFRSQVYTLLEPTRFIGAFRTPTAFSAIGPDQLELREGCDLLLEWNADTDEYRGSTAEQTCESNLRGARWAYSEAVISPSGMRSWDKGLDAEGQQIWGPEKGPYDFVKVSGSPR